MLPNSPNIRTYVYLSEIGYQVEVYAHHENGDIKHATACRDFTGTYEVEKIVDLVANALVDALRNFERTL